MKKRILAIILIVFTFILISCSSKMYNYDLSEYVTLTQYKGIEIPLDDLNTQLDSKIKDLLSEKATDTVIENREAQMGDLVNIDYTGYMDGIVFEGGSATEYDLVLGDKVFIEGFEEGIVGHNTGDEFEIIVNFPKDYTANPDYAGKEATFLIKLNSISEHILPEWNDAFVDENTDFSTISEYEADAILTLKRNYVWNRVIALNTILKYPNDQIKEYYDSLISYYNSYAAQYSVTLEGFVESYLGKSIDTFLTEIAENAKNQVRQEMIMYSIARTENFDITEQDYKDLREEYAEKLGYDSVAELEKNHKKDNLKMNMLMDKIMDYTLAQAVEVDSLSEEE